MSREMEERVAAIAGRQHGVVTRAQLLELGLLRGAVRRRLASGRMRPLHRGVYLAGPVMPPRAREMAAVLACGPAALLSHRSAAKLSGLIAPEAETGDVARVEIGVPRGHNGARPGIRVRKLGRLGADERTVLDGIPLTSVPRTLSDLAAVASARTLEQAVAVAERERLVDRRQLEALVERYRGRPGVAALRAVLSRDGGPVLTRSEAEARFLELVRAARLPAPEVNVLVDGYEIDFLWRDQRVAVEIDGFRFHGSRPRFESDRRRMARLAALGIHVIPLTWRQITDDAVATAVQLGQVLALAGRG